MRTAVCLSGLPREISSCWRSFYDYLLVNLPDPDVFIYSGEHYPADEEFFGLIKPKKYLVEPQIRYPEMEELLARTFYFGPGESNAFIQQMYGLAKVCQLKKMYEQEINAKYDLVVRARPDYFYIRPITLDMLELDKINTLHGTKNPNMSIEFAIGPNDDMEKYLDLFNWVKNHGEEWLTKTNSHYQAGYGFNCDTIISVCLLDYHKLNRASEKIPEGLSPYSYYRIMKCHVVGQYSHLQ